MFWENAQVLLLLWILPLVAWVLVHAHRRRLAAARTFADPAMVARLMPSLIGPRAWVKGTLLIVGLGLLIVAGARPRFGVYTETVRQRGVDLFVLLDVSRSMTAEDVAPSRLERAKSDVRDLLPHLAGDRVGLIVFAGKPVVKVPLTSDEGFFRMVLDEVDVNSAPRGGTLIGDAIRKAMETLPRSRDRDQVLVLITDGEDQDSYAEDAAKEAAERGMKIFTVGLGDAGEGARIPVRDDAGRLTYLQYEGQERWSKLNGKLLEQIALTTGGAYIPAGTRAYDLGQVYADHLAGLTRSEYQAEKTKRYREQFQLFVGLGVLLLLLEMGIASYRPGGNGPPSRLPLAARRERGRVRVRVLRCNFYAPCAHIVHYLYTIWLRLRRVTNEDVDQGNPPSPPAPLPQAGEGRDNTSHRGMVGLPGTVLVLAILVLPSFAMAGAREAGEKVRQGIASYKAGNYKDAAAAFGEADQAQPDDLRIAFNRGVALAAGDEPDKAVELLQKAALSPDMDLALRARYNLGCLAAAKAKKRFGEHPETAARDVRKDGLADLATAVGHFRDCLRMDKDHADARHNLELIRLWIKSMQSLWEQNDRKKQREEMDLAAFLQMLEEKQRGLRAVCGALKDVGPSPKRRQAIRAAEEAQRNLGEEIGPLKEKIEATLSKAGQPASGTAAAPAAPSDEIKKAITQLQALADEAGRDIESSAAKLHSGKAEDAVTPQAETVEMFNQMYRDVAPYPSLVGRAVATQQGLVPQVDEENSPGATGVSPVPPASTGETPVAPGKLPTSSQGSLPSPPAPIPEAEARELAWNQDFVTRYAEVLAPLAKAGLKQLESTPAAPSSGGSSAPAKPGSGPSEEDLQKQREGLKKSMEKAVELAPKVEKLSGEAAASLRNRKPAEALPKQQEALKLLKEIAEPLPKQKPQKDENKKDENKQDQQQKQDQKPSKQDEKQQQQKEQQESAQQQAEAAIRQVQERQHERQEKEKQLRRYLLRSNKVDKDW
jgi:Ca-activated chloride channel family protein